MTGVIPTPLISLYLFMLTLSSSPITDGWADLVFYCLFPKYCMNLFLLLSFFNSFSSCFLFFKNSSLEIMPVMIPNLTMFTWEMLSIINKKWSFDIGVSSITINGASSFLKRLSSKSTGKFQNCSIAYCYLCTFEWMFS